MSELEQIHDHTERMEANTPGARRTPGFLGLVRALGSGVQSFEDAIWDVLMQMSPELARGAWLDRLGALVGEPRGGLDDSAYARWIQARCLVPLARTRIDRVLEVVRIATSAVHVRYRPTYPAAFTLEVIPGADLDAEQEARLVLLVEELAPIGVGVNVVRAEVGYFGFDGDPNALGFGEGTLAGLI